MASSTNASQKDRGKGYSMSKYPSGVSPFHTPTGTPEVSFIKERVPGAHLLYWYNQTYLLTGTNVQILTPEDQGERRSVQVRSA